MSMEPLIPSDVDLRGLPWMRLDTSRLLDSDLFALSTGDEFKAAVALWCKSWTQMPAGSLPTDDRVLAHLSGAGSRWKKVKAMALRGWSLADDGRLYHSVVAEQVLAAWKEREEYRGRLDGQVTRQRNLREERAALMADLKAAGVHLAWNAPMHEVRTCHANLSQPVTVTTATCHGDSHGLDGTGRDESKEQELTEPNGSDAGASPSEPVDPIWGTGLAFLIRKGIPEKPARALLGKVKQACGDIEAGALLADAEAQDITDPAPWLMAAASKRRARAGPNGQQPMGKQAQGMMALEAMKSGNRMAARRTADGVPEALLLGPGAHAGR